LHFDHGKANCHFEKDVDGDRVDRVGRGPPTPRQSPEGRKEMNNEQRERSTANLRVSYQKAKELQAHIKELQGDLATEHLTTDYEFPECVEGMVNDLDDIADLLNQLYAAVSMSGPHTRSGVEE
jgi:hypothetical protein